MENQIRIPQPTATAENRPVIQILGFDWLSTSAANLRGCLKSPDSVKFGDKGRDYTE